MLRQSIRGFLSVRSLGLSAATTSVKRMTVADTKSEKASESTRVQFEFSPNMLKLLNRLVQETEATTRAEVVRRAISVYALILDESKLDKELMFVNRKTKESERF